MDGNENQSQEIVAKKKKDLFLEKLKAKYPEMDFDDEENLYGQVDQDYSEYETKLTDSSRNEQELTNLLSSDPRSADFLINWKNGDNPIVLLMRMFGDDFREALDDPQLQDKLAEARNAYIERQTKDKSLQEDAKANLAQSLEDLDALQAECKLNDQQTDTIFKTLMEIADGAIVNKVSKETWSFLHKAINYEKDIAAAVHEAEVRGRNTKIDATKVKTTVPENLPPTISGNGGVVGQPHKDLGVLERYGDGADDIFSRGGMRRNRR